PRAPGPWRSADRPWTCRGGTRRLPLRGCAMVPQPTRHDESELAEAIRFGARRRSEQAFGEYYQGRHASCALGAAYEGLYRLPEEVGELHPKRLDRLWECLEGTIRTCPEGCRKRLILAAMIIHLNDDH